MYPFWNSYYTPFMMGVPSYLSFFQPQMPINPSQLIPPNQIISNDQPNFSEVTKNIEKNTQQPSKSIIQISSDSESQIQQIEPRKNLEKKELQFKKPKLDRFLGFKQGIFEKENNQPTKSTRNLRKRAVLTRARLRKYKEKNAQQKISERKKAIQKPISSKKMRQSPRLSKNRQSLKSRMEEKKPRNRQFGRLKKYLKFVGKTVDLPEMYTLKSSYLKTIETKKQNLLLRQID